MSHAAHEVWVPWEGAAEDKPAPKTPHVFAQLKRMPWLRCRACGLLTLRNPLTRKAMKEGCSK